MFCSIVLMISQSHFSAQSSAQLEFESDVKASVSQFVVTENREIAFGKLMYGDRGRIVRVKLKTAEITTMAARTDGNFAVLSPNEFLVYDAATKRIIDMTPEGKCLGGSIAGDSDFLYLSKRGLLGYRRPDASIGIYSWKEKKEIASWNLGDSFLSGISGFSLTGSLVIRKPIQENFLWSPPYDIPGIKLSGAGYVVGACFSRDGSKVALGTDENLVHVIDTKQNRLIKSVGRKLRAVRVTAMDFSSDDGFLVTGNSIGDMIVRESKGFAEIFNVRPNGASIFQISCVGDQGHIYTSADGERFAIWRLRH